MKESAELRLGVEEGWVENTSGRICHVPVVGPSNPKNLQGRCIQERTPQAGVGWRHQQRQRCVGESA